jgi:hypothetical protein
MSTRLVVVLVAALIALGVTWFLSTHDRVAAEEWVGPSGEARLKPFLAAERFADRMGLDATEVRSLPALAELPPRGVLLVSNHRQELHPAKLAELLAWVEKGGHLVAEAEPMGVPDPLLEQLEVSRTHAEPLRQPFVAELAPRRLRVHLPDAMQLEVAADLRLNLGSRLISFERGRGVVSVATSLRFARNPGWEDHFAGVRQRPAHSIGAHDHAELFWRLLTLTPATELTVYFRPERLSLWGFLKAQAPFALAACALLLVLWLWRIAPRFGPVAPDAPPGTRRLLDHLRASGRYYWVNGLRSRLVVAARDAALRRVARAQPDFANAAQAERAARLAALTGISKEEAQRFMSAAGAMRGADFIRLAQHAQRVHSALEKGTRKER